jgi:hypothetical protein
MIGSSSSLLPLSLRDGTTFQDWRSSIEYKDRLDSMKQQFIDTPQETYMFSSYISHCSRG